MLLDTNRLTGTLPDELTLLENTDVDYCKCDCLLKASARLLCLTLLFLSKDGNDITEDAFL